MWRSVPRSTSSSAGASVVLVFALFVAGCGHRQQQHAENARDLFVRAQHGLSQIHSGTVTVHARADTPIPLQRTQKLPAQDVPFSQLRLTRWTRKPHRVACQAGLECVRGEVAVDEALRDLSPLLPPDLPIDPSAVHDAVVQIALRGRRPVSVKLNGQIDAGFLLGDVPFEVVLDLPRG